MGGPDQPHPVGDAVIGVEQHVDPDDGDHPGVPLPRRQVPRRDVGVQRGVAEQSQELPDPHGGDRHQAHRDRGARVAAQIGTRPGRPGRSRPPSLRAAAHSMASRIMKNGTANSTGSRIGGGSTDSMSAIRSTRHLPADSLTPVTGRYPAAATRYVPDHAQMGVLVRRDHRRGHRHAGHCGRPRITRRGWCWSWSDTSTAFVMLTRVLRAGMPVGVAYGIWGAMGTALTAAIAAVIFDDPFTTADHRRHRADHRRGADGGVRFPPRCRRGRRPMMWLTLAGGDPRRGVRNAVAAGLRRIP